MSFSVIITDVSNFILSEIGIKMKSPISDEKSVFPAQCRAARALIEWTRDDLAAACQTARSTLADFEANKRQPHPRTLAAIRTALEAAGVIFIASNGDGPGVRLRKGVEADATP